MRINSEIGLNDSLWVRKERTAFPVISSPKLQKEVAIFHGLKLITMNIKSMLIMWFYFLVH